MDEKEYLRGQRWVWLQLLNEALRNLQAFKDSKELQLTELQKALVQVGKLASEREEVVAMLRSLCEDFGDNDWESDTHLADVVDKHLGRYLHERENEP
jgi:hypothetical protein